MASSTIPGRWWDSTPTAGATKAALEAHSVNLAAELAGTGVTVNVYRLGAVDTAMQAWFRSQPPERIGATLHEHFQSSYEQGSLITPEKSARGLLARLSGSGSGEIGPSATPEQRSGVEKESSMTVKLGLLALLEAKPGRGSDLAAFLEAGRALAVAETGTITWYAFKISDTRYGIFDSFETEDTRQAHLGGEIPTALGQIAAELLAAPPDISPIDVIAVK